MVVRQLYDLEALSADKASQELHLQQAVQAESLKAMKNTIDIITIKTCLQRELIRTSLPPPWWSLSAGMVAERATASAREGSGAVHRMQLGTRTEREEDHLGESKDILAGATGVQRSPGRGTRQNTGAVQGH